MVDPTSETVGRNLKMFRTERGLTIERLSTMLEAAGHRIGWSMLSRTERGLRRATVGDLMALACALEISPLDLLVPMGDGVTEVSGFGPAPAPAIRDWVQVGGPLEDQLDAHQVIFT